MKSAIVVELDNARQAAVEEAALVVQAFYLGGNGELRRKITDLTMAIDRVRTLESRCPEWARDNCPQHSVDGISLHPAGFSIGTKEP